MASITCSKTGCLYTTSDQVDNDTPLTDKLVLLRIHADVEHSNGPPQGNNGASSSVKAKMEPPKLHAGSDVQAWDQFIARWTIFKSTMNIGVTSASMWLFNCLDQELGDAVLQANIGTAPQDMTEQDLTQSIKQLAVKNESKLVHRIKLGRTSQPPGVPVRNHLSTLRGLARQCEYLAKCTNCEHMLDFSQEVIQDQLIRGLNDPEIVSELLGDSKVDMSLKEVVEFVARKEQAKTERGTVSVEQSVSAVMNNPTTPQSKQPCRHCKGQSHGAETRQVRRDKCPAWSHTCDKCDVKGHYATACYKCQDCDSWGHKSKKSRWCNKSDNTSQKKDMEGGAITHNCPPRLHHSAGQHHQQPQGTQAVHHDQ